jgi:hypothetical protein
VTKLRAGDGVHFSKAGALVAAHYPERELRRAFGDAPIAAAPTVTSPLAPDIVPPPGETATAPTEPGEEPEKPEYGPVMPLETVETSPGGALLGNGVPAGPSAMASTAPVAAPAGTSPAADPNAAKVLKRGEPLTPREGRADDFRWQRVTPNPEPVKTSSRPPEPGGEMR